MKCISIRIPVPESSPDFLKQIKVAAAIDGKSLGTWTAEALVAKLQGDSKIAEGIRDVWKNRAAGSE